MSTSEAHQKPSHASVTEGTPKPSNEGRWTTIESTDAMTDKILYQLVITATSKETLTLLRRENNEIWLFVKLDGANQFGVGTDLTIRIDANEPGTYDDSFDKFTAQIKSPTHTWEWNPSLIGFRAAQYTTNKGENNVCALLRELSGAKKIVVRYRPNQSTFKDITFLPSGNGESISDVFHMNLETCIRTDA